MKGSAYNSLPSKPGVAHSAACVNPGEKNGYFTEWSRHEALVL